MLTQPAMPPPTGIIPNEINQMKLTIHTCAHANILCKGQQGGTAAHANWNHHGAQ